MSITATAPASRTRWFAPAFGIAVLVVGALVTGYAAATADARFVAAGLPFPGTATSVAEFVGYFAATLAGAVTFGSLMYIVTASVPDGDGRIDGPGYRMHLWVERSAILWFCLAAVMIVVDAANAAGAPVVQVISNGAIGDALGASESGRGWCAVAIAASSRPLAH